MKYKHIKSRPTPEIILAHLGRNDIPITDVSVTEGYTEAGEPFVEVDFGNAQLSTEEEGRLKGYLGDLASEIADLKARIKTLERAALPLKPIK